MARYTSPRFSKLESPELIFWLETGVSGTNIHKNLCLSGLCVMNYDQMLVNLSFFSLCSFGPFKKKINFGSCILSFPTKDIHPWWFKKRVGNHAWKVLSSVDSSLYRWRYFTPTDMAGGPVKLDSMWQHRLTRLVRDRYMYSIRITV